MNILESVLMARFYNSIPPDFLASCSAAGIINSPNCAFVGTLAMGKLDEATWKRQAERKRLKTPSFIDILCTDQVLKFDVDKGFSKGETIQAGFFLPKEIIAVVRPHAFKAADNMMSKSSDDVDQKTVVKDNMEMKVDIQVIPWDDSAQNTSDTGDVKFSMQTKACSRNGIHGLYSFRMEGSRLNEMFEKAGRYRFIFPL